MEGVDDASNLGRHAGPGAARVELQFDAIGVGSVAQGKLRRSHSQTYLECVLGGLRSSGSEGVDVDSTAVADSSEGASASDSGPLDLEQDLASSGSAVGFEPTPLRTDALSQRLVVAYIASVCQEPRSR